MVKAPAATCVTHRRRPKVAACGVCGNGLCTDCIVHTPVGVKCRSCTGVRGAGVDTGAHVSVGSAPATTAGSRARRRPLWAAVLVAGGLVVLVVAAVALLSRESGPGDTGAVDAGLAAPFTERHTQFVGAGGQNLAGTLTLPGAGDGKNVPAVLIVPGLGAIDRNSVAVATTDAARDTLVASVSGIGISGGEPLFKDLGESLAKAGIASFRYEKRGTTTSPLRPGQKLSFDDEVGDARAALELLAQRQEVGDAPLALLGHDSGGVVAMRLAAGNARVKAVVAVSTPGRPLADVLADDLARTRGAAVADQFRATAAALVASGKAPPPETVPEVLRPVFAPGHDAYLSTLFTLDPATAAAGVPVPVLLVRGGADKSVTSADTDRLSSALRSGAEAIVGSSDADHNLALSGAGHEHSNTASTPASRLDAELGARLTTWVKTRLTG